MKENRDKKNVHTHQGTSAPPTFFASTHPPQANALPMPDNCLNFLIEHIVFFREFFNSLNALYQEEIKGKGKCQLKQDGELIRKVKNFLDNPEGLDEESAKNIIEIYLKDLKDNDKIISFIRMIMDFNLRLVNPLP